MEDFQLDEKSDTPLWVQLKRRLGYLIYSHVYDKGDQLPTVREMSSHLKVAYNTVSKVYRDLERDGLIRTKQGSGTFVVYEGGAQGEDPDAEVEAIAIKLVTEARKAGMLDDEVLSLVSQWLERTKE